MYAILFDYFVDYELLKMLRIFQTNKYILSLTCFKQYFRRTLNFINQSARYFVFLLSQATLLYILLLFLLSYWRETFDRVYFIYGR